MVERPLHALVAEFDDVASVKRAATAVRDAGYQRFDVYSPFPIHGIDRAMGVRPTHLPWIVLVCGLSGTGIALLLQWWTNAVDYPFSISGKPLFGIAASIPITFELTVLLASLAAFFGMFVLNRLPEHHHPLFDLARFRRATDDGFFLAIEAGDERFDVVRTRALLESLSSHPVEVCHASIESAALPGWLKTSLAGVTVLALVPLAVFAARRGATTDQLPVHLVNDMDFQPKYRAQSANAFFADGRAMRPDAAGTVARGELAEDETIATGKHGDTWSEQLPLAVTPELMARGRERFAIFCTPCHGAAGYGDGLVALRAKDLQEANWVPPASLHDPLVRSRSVGQLFDTVRNGVRTMPGYARQMPREDSWAIVAFIRALQRSQQGALTDVPESERAALEAH